jgi:hypothetical protein
LNGDYKPNCKDYHIRWYFRAILEQDAVFGDSGDVCAILDLDATSATSWLAPVPAESSH